jgi:2-C-methyl-D-erythritol 4-phosphate cytidylyltransferase
MVHVSWAVVLAVGKGQQLAAEIETAYLGIGSRPVLAHSLVAFEHCREVDGLVVVASKERLEVVRAMAQRFGCAKLHRVVPGFQQRRASLLAGLKALPEEVTLVTIHDVARPCVTPEMIARAVESAKRYGSGVTASRIEDPVQFVEKGLKAEKAFAAGTFWAVQTPQTYRRDLLDRALDAAQKKKLDLDEESAALPLVGEAAHLVECTRANLRIRTPDHLALAAQFLP